MSEMQREYNAVVGEMVRAWMSDLLDCFRQRDELQCRLRLDFILKDLGILLRPGTAWESLGRNGSLVVLNSALHRARILLAQGRLDAAAGMSIGAFAEFMRVDR
jgi:hypothetical protein